jgi:hypothetical protein
MNLKERIKKILKEEVTGLEWMMDTGPGYEMFINKAFYFEPKAREGDIDYTKLVNYLINLGFESEYGTPEVLDEYGTAVGLYSYLNRESELKFVYTTHLDDYDEDYEEHIKEFANGVSEDYGKNLELIDARKFIKNFGV